MSQQRTPVTTHHVEVHATEVRKTYRCTDHDEPAREWAALQHLATHAPDLAPAPLRRERDGDDEVLVMSRLPGGLLTGPVTPQQTRALGHALRRLLSVPLPPGVPVRSNPPAELRARYAPWLAEATPAGARTTQAVGAALAWLAEKSDDASWLVDPVVALGDGNLDNLLWDGDTCRLLDWEEFGVSDLTHEVADLVEHVSSRLEGRLDVEALLVELALTPAQTQRLAEHRRHFACFWLAMLLPGRPAAHRNPPGALADQAEHVLTLLGNS